MRFFRRTLADLTIDGDEGAFGGIDLYRELKQRLVDARHELLVPEDEIPWDRALFLNLAFYDPSGASDVLTGPSIPPDVVCHVAWHRLAHGQVGDSPGAALFAEAIASAFDLWLVGRLLASPVATSFLDTQVPAMAEAAQAAGLDAAAFEAMLASIADDPDAAFEDLRALLFDGAKALAACRTPLEGEAVLEALEERRFFPLLHHYALASWVLSVRAKKGPLEDPVVKKLDRALRKAPSSIEKLRADWVVTRAARPARPRSRPASRPTRRR